METVEVVVKIPKQVYEHINVWKDIVYDDYIVMVTNAILNGTVLPKGHDRLISTGDLDITKLVDSDIEWVMGRCDISRVQDMIDNAPTVIEVNREAEDGR